MSQAPEFTSILNVPLKLDKAAAIALARVIRRVSPEDFGADPRARCALTVAAGNAR
jgi:hypothetical protein